MKSSSHSALQVYTHAIIHVSKETECIGPSTVYILTSENNQLQLSFRRSPTSSLSHINQRHLIHEFTLRSTFAVLHYTDPSDSHHPLMLSSVHGSEFPSEISVRNFRLKFQRTRIVLVITTLPSEKLLILSDHQSYTYIGLSFRIRIPAQTWLSDN